MKKFILIILLVFNFSAFLCVDDQHLGVTVSAQTKCWEANTGSIYNSNGTYSSSDGIFSRFWNWMMSLFQGNEERRREVEQVVKGCEYDNSETYYTSYSIYNFFNFDWYIIDDDGDKLYYNPSGGGDFTTGEIEVLSRLGQSAAEFFTLNPEVDLGSNTTEHHLTVNGSTTEYYNNSNIVLQNYGNASVNLQIHYNGDDPQGSSIPNGTIDDPNPSSETYDWYVNNAFMGSNPELHINPGPVPTSIKVKKSSGEVVLNATIKKKDDGIENNSGNNTYVSPDGVPFTLPAGCKIMTYNIDQDNFTNGALYGFITPGGIEYIFKEENSFKGTTGTPKFTTAVRINDKGGKREYTTDKYTGFTYPARTNSPIEVIRVRKVKENGICKILVEKVSYTVPATVANTLSGAARQQNTAIEDAPVIAVVNSIDIPCPSGTTGNSRNSKILQDYLNDKKQEVKEFLINKVKNSVKFYIAESAGSNVLHTITKTAANDLSAAQQTGETNKFNNGNFTAADEDIAIKMYLEEGKWKYEVKYNPNKIQPNSKIAPVLQQVKDEIKRQADDEVRKLRTPKSQSDAVEELVEGGEKFAKAKMDMLQAIAAIYDVGKEIINEGKMPENIWDNGSRSAGTDQSVKDKYNKSAFNAPSLVGGGVDQLIDEATGAVQLVKAGLEIVRKPVESAKGLWNTVKTLNKDKIKQFALDASGITNYQQGGSRATYQAGMHGVKLAMIVAAGVKVLTEGKELVEKAAKEVDDIQKFIPDGTTNHAATDALKNAAENRKIVQKIDEDKLLTQNVEGGQTKMVAIEKRGNEVDIYKYDKDDYKKPDGTTPTDAELEQLVKQDLAEDIMPPFTTRPADYPDYGTPNANTTYNPQGRKNLKWNKELNKFPPKANHKYVTKNAAYNTNASGQVTKVQIKKLEKDPNFDYNNYRNQHQQQKSVNVKGGNKQGADPDQGSHLLGNQFGGPGEQINLVPMKQSLNQGAWKNMETDWANKIKNGTTITDIEIDIIYDSTGRPSKFVVKWKENGIAMPEKIHLN